MKRTLIIAASVLAAGGIAATPAVAGLSGNPSFSHQIPVRAPSQAVTPTFADDSGHHAATTPTSARSAEPGDDRGGATRHAEPGDDRGSATRHVEPGDDRGGATHHTEPGDDRGGATSEAGDDSGGHGGSSGGGGSSSGSSGGGGSSGGSDDGGGSGGRH